MLDLKFMGPPEISFDGKPLKFATRKALALFAYLVVESGAHPREKLMSLFWPESETHLAQSALRNTLARIKEALRGIDEPLQMEGDRIRIELSIASTLDLELVAWATPESQPKKTPAPTLAQLQNAADALRGPFMDGFSLPDAPAFDEWLTIQRANWGHRQNLIYDRLSLQQLENHLIQPAIETVLRWIILDRLNEVAYRRLMRLQFLNGDRSAALQAYETCREVLIHELGIQPSAETEDTLAYIRSSPTPAPVAESDTEAREALHIPFVGRSHEYQGLVQTFRLIRKGKPQVVVLSGESGIGKTRLSDEFLKWARTEGADVLRGRAFETSGQLPYQPIIDALRERLERENAPEDLLDDAWLAELTRVLPELRERYPDLPSASGDDSTARSRLFEAVARLAEALSARQPLIWLMDDLQWADAETLALLHYLSRNWQKGHAPILLLILMRAEALAHGSALRDWMSGLTRDVPTTRFTLSAMKAEDVQQLISSLAGDNAPGSSDLSAWFTAETAGQPFFLAETLIALNEYRALIWRGEPSARKLDPQATLDNLKSLGPQSLAPAIRDVILSRLEWLSQSASALLSAASVIGRNCRFELLSQVSGIDEQDSLNALDELLSARMIVEIKNEARPYTVSHDRIREVVYAQLSTARQQTFHRRALSALTERNASPAELAHHALSAKEWGFAFQHSLRAGDEAMRLYAVAGAVQHYETARMLLNEKKADVDNETCQHLYTRLGQAYEFEYHHRQSVIVYEEMQMQASTRGSRKMELAALAARCIIHSRPYDTQDVEQVRALAVQALPLSISLGDLEAQAQIELSLAWSHKYGDAKIEPAIVHFHATEQLARKADLRDLLGVTMMELGVVFMSHGQLTQAESALTEAVELFREQNHRQRLRTGLHNLAVIQMEIGNLDTAQALLDQARQSSGTIDNPNDDYFLATTGHIIHILRGAYDQALDSLLPALEIGDTTVVTRLEVDLRHELGWVYYDLGAYEESLNQCRKALNMHTSVPTIGWSPTFTIMALCQVRRGEFSEAESTLKTGWKHFDLQWEMHTGWWETPSILLAEAELALARSDLSRAMQCARQLLAKFDELNLRHFRPGILLLRAKIELATGNKDGAYCAVSDALTLSDEMGAHREVWEMCAMLRKLEMERGNESAAIQMKERACNEAMLIAEHAGTLELRKIFMSRADVQLVVNAL